MKFRRGGPSVQHACFRAITISCSRLQAALTVRRCAVDAEAPLVDGKSARQQKWLFEKVPSHSMMDWVLCSMGGSMAYKKGLIKGSGAKKGKRGAEQEPSEAPAPKKKPRKNGGARTADNNPEIMSEKINVSGLKQRELFFLDDVVKAITHACQDASVAQERSSATFVDRCRQVKEVMYSIALEFAWLGKLSYKGKVHKGWSTLRAALQESVTHHLQPLVGDGMQDGEDLSAAELGEKLLENLAAEATACADDDDGEEDDLGKRLEATQRQRTQAHQPATRKQRA